MKKPMVWTWLNYCAADDSYVVRVFTTKAKALKAVATECLDYIKVHCSRDEELEAREYYSLRKWDKVIEVWSDYNGNTDTGNWLDVDWAYLEETVA